MLKKTRPSSGAGLGGLLRYNQIYRGNIGLFGGIEYETNLKGLQQKLISSDSYEKDSPYLLDSTLSNHSKLNYTRLFIKRKYNIASYYVQEKNLV